MKQYVFYDIERDLIFSIHKTLYGNTILENPWGMFYLDYKLTTYLRTCRKQPEKWLELGTV